MRTQLPDILEHSRELHGDYASLPDSGPSGRFRINYKDVTLLVVVSNGAGWEHTSVSVMNKKRCPIWEEMCFVKDLFWDPEEIVVQFHPRHSTYVNFHPYVLHQWREVGKDFNAPPSILVGPRKRH